MTQIAIIHKNAIDEVRVSLAEYKGHTYLDVRIYTEIEGRSEKIPTKRGITLRPDLLPELRAALGGGRGPGAKGWAGEVMSPRC